MMIKAKHNLKTDINQNLDELLKVLNSYDGESLYLATFNEFFINYLNVTFKNIANHNRFMAASITPPYGLSVKHPFVHILYRIFEGKTVQKALKDKINTLFVTHNNHPLRAFIELFTKVNRASNAFKEGIINGISDENILVLLWALKFRPEFIVDIANEVFTPLSKMGFAYASSLLLKCSVINGDNEEIIRENLSLVIAQSNVSYKEWLANYLTYLVSKSQDVDLKILLLKLGIAYECLTLLLPLAATIENATHLGEKRYLEAYKYVVLAEFHNILGAKEKLDEYSALIKFVIK